jgi:hypothetical protein
MAFDLTYLVVGIALLLAAFVKGVTGLGFPLIATPTVALLLDIRTAVTVLILPNLFMDSAQVIRDGLPYEIFRRFKAFIAPTIVGVFLGNSGAGQDTPVDSQSLSRRDGADLRDFEPAQTRVHRVATTGEISFAAIWLSQRFSKRRDQCRWAGVGDLFTASSWKSVPS